MNMYQPNTMYPNMAQSPQNYQPNLQSQSNGILWVQGESGAKSWMVSPGSTVLLMDSESERFYVKSADNAGMPTMKVYEYYELDESQASDKGDSATRKEFDEIWEKLKSIERKLKKKQKAEDDDE